MSDKKRKAKEVFKTIKNKIFDLLFPKNIKCCFCGEELNSQAKKNTCEACVKSLPFIKNPCLKCGSEMGNNTQGLCLKCSKHNMDFLLARAVFSYEGRVVNMIKKIKYDGQTQKIENVIDYIINCYNQHNLHADVVTFVPMTKSKIKWRGYNQSQLMAEEFAKQKGLEIVETCEKVVDNESQTGFDFAKRKLNVENNFKFLTEHKDKIKNKTVLIVDDVVTTGATVSEIARLIKKNGAKECLVLSFAHTRIKQDN